MGPPAAAVPASWGLLPASDAAVQFGSLLPSNPVGHKPDTRSKAPGPSAPHQARGLPPRGHLRLTGLLQLSGLGVPSAFLTVFGIEDSGMNDKDIVFDIMEPPTFHGT